MVAQNYVDFEDIDNPLKQVLNEVFIEDLLIEPYKETTASISLAQNFLEVSDNYFDPLSRPERDWSFLTIEEKNVRV